MNNEATISYKVLLSIFGSILIAVIGFFGSAYLNKLTDIEKSIVQVQKDIVQLQSTMINRGEIKEMIKDEIAKYHMEFYK